MKTSSFLANAAAGLTFAVLAGCGGGGGGGGGGLGALVYSGNSAQAVITTTNASRLASNIIGSDDAARIIAGVSTEGSNAPQIRDTGLVDLTRRLSRNFRDVAVRAKRETSAQQMASGTLVSVNEMEPCDNGVGSTQVTGMIDDVTGLGTLQVRFIGCLLDGITVNGQATLRIDAIDLGFFPPIPTDITISFARLTFREALISIDAGGSLRVQLNIFANSETITADLTQLDNNASRMIKTANLMIVTLYDNIMNPTSFTATVNGQVFDDVHGFVVVSTPVNLIFSSVNQQFPNGGQVLLTGTNSSVLAIALNSTMVELQLDLDGVGGINNTARLKWTELGGPVGADLGDSDADGMHNSWETANVGMNPNNISDALLDNDGDGATNLMEYWGGSNPNDLFSVPSAIDLQLNVTDGPDPIGVGFPLAYTIFVTNLSSIAASNVVVTDTLPASVTFVSAMPSQGSCSEMAGTVTCNLGTIGGFVNANIVIQVMPTAPGLISNTASVSSSTSFDLNAVNNSWTELTTVN